MEIRHPEKDRPGRAARPRWRRSQRGAAMIEAIVAIPFFLVIFSSMVFIGNLYRNKLKTHRQAMEEGWMKASAGCDPTAVGPIPGTSGIDLGDAAKAPGAQLCQVGFGKVEVTKSSATQASGVLGGFSTNASTKTTVICNEKPASGDFEGASEFLWDLFKPKEEE